MSHPHPELGPPPELPEGGLRIVALGGLGEVGRNMTVFEYDGRLLIVDCGVLFPDDHHPGAALQRPQKQRCHGRSQGSVLPQPARADGGLAAAVPTGPALASPTLVRTGRPVLTKPFLLVNQHPVTTEYGQGKDQIWETLMALHELKIPTIMLWPNVDAGSDGTSKGIRAYREQENPDNMHFFKNMAPTDFLKLLVGARCLLGLATAQQRQQ